jgi:putative endonuclease
MHTPLDAPPTFADPRHQLGYAGELAAARWFTRHGWYVEAHRWKFGRHDLDLILRRADLVAFVEVKVRTTPVCGGGEEAISRRKRRVIEQAAWSWILRHGRPGDQYSFDVVTITGPKGSRRIAHLPDAWRPGWR